MLPPGMVQEAVEAFERCRRRYPTIALTVEQFSSRIEEIIRKGHRDHQPGDEGGTSIDACSECLSLFRQLHHEDLFLATGCARGDRIAWEYFADDYLPLLRGFARQACRNFDAGEDLAQEIVVVLLGESAAPGDESRQQRQEDETLQPVAAKGKLTTYNGRGSLAGWLRASVAHAAIDRFRRGTKQVSLDEMTAQGSEPRPADAGQGARNEESLDARWGPVLSRALEQELLCLSARDRLLLSLYYLEGIPLKTIGRQFGVHEATASRWLERLRQGVRQRVERKLRRAHGLGPRDVRSLWHWVCENEDPAFESVLRLSTSAAARRKNVQGGMA